jgi:amino acid adenylation domain-containing protein
MAGDVPFYNETMTVYRQGTLDTAILEDCLVTILRRHEIWRTTFDVVTGEIVQIVHPAPSSFSFPVADLRHLPAVQREAEAQRLATIDAKRPFDLKSGPLLRALLVRMDDEQHRIYVTVHQIIFDAVSAYRVFVPELAALYEAFSKGNPSPLADLEIQYADFAWSQRAKLTPHALAEHVDYWKRQLAGELPVLQWPNNRPRPLVESHRGAVQRFSFPRDLVDGLRELARREGASSYMTLLAGLATLLFRYTGQNDIVLGSFTASRKLAEVEPLLGYFVNPLPLRIDLSGKPSFAEVLARVRDVVLDALAHGDLPFVHIVQQAEFGPDPSRNPLFQVALSQQPRVGPLAPEWDLKTEEISNGGSKFDLVIVLDEREDAIFGPITYNPDLFDASTIARTVEHWQTLLSAAAQDPARHISDLPLLPEKERRQILTGWNDTRMDYPSQACVHERIEAQVEKTPQAIAVSYGNDSLSYRELNARANQLARWLRKLGVGRESLVGISMERGLEMVVSLLAVMKAGGAYVPLDPAFPKSRLSFTIEDSELRFLIAGQSSGFADGYDGKLISMDRDQEAIALESRENLSVQAGPDSLVYVIYTSGSTGRPKGVQISHGALVNLLTSMLAQPGLEPENSLLAVTTISFDIAALELYLPLVSGARCVIASREAASDASQLRALLEDEDITVMQATPSTWKMLLDSGWHGKSNLKLLCGGEALSRELAAGLLPKARSLWNLYGPTETTVWSAVQPITSADGPIAIGRPIGNTEMYVLDDNFEPVPAGVIGELYIGGAGLARGYLKRPQLDAEKFIANPFVAEPNSRLYRTGDLARYQPDGCIECLGRIDSQVKVRGFRIELGEIESLLREHPAVRDACAAVREDIPGDQRLVVYVVPHKMAVELDDVHGFLKERLPGYMMPILVPLERLPLTPNGKLDRRALPAPADAEASGVEEPIDPIEQLLASMWKDFLNVQQVDVFDNFFDLGGHSLLATQLVARMEEELGVHIKPKDLAFQTLRQLAAGCREQPPCP